MPWLPIEWRPALLMIILSLGTPCGAASLSRESTALAQDPVARFKRLLESPPVIEHMLFREKLPSAPNQSITLSGGIGASTNYAMYELRSQTNGLLVRRLASRDDLTTSRISGTAFTLWEDRFWFLDAGTNAFLYYLEHERVRHQ